MKYILKLITFDFMDNNLQISSLTKKLNVVDNNVLNLQKMSKEILGSVDQVFVPTLRIYFTTNTFLGRRLELW